VSKKRKNSLYKGPQKNFENRHMARSGQGNNNPVHLIKMSAGWVFTINNPECETLEFAEHAMVYLVYGIEVGKQGTKHIQGYVQFTKKRKLETARKLILYTDKEEAVFKGKKRTLVKMKNKVAKCHMEMQKGTAEQASTYCKKDGKFIEVGKIDNEIGPKISRQGFRSDLQGLMDMVKEGKSVLQMMETAPEDFSKHMKFVAKYQEEIKAKERKEIEYPIHLPWCVINKPKEAEKKRHIYIHGPPNCGKTTIIQEAMAGKKVFFVKTGEKYRYEGYKGEEIIVYDDVNKLPRDELISAANVYKSTQEVAGESRYCKNYWTANQARIIIILSNHEPWFAKGEHPDHALMARFKIIKASPEDSEFWDEDKLILETISSYIMKEEIKAAPLAGARVRRPTHAGIPLPEGPAGPKPANQRPSLRGAQRWPPAGRM
jgi:hypothetical protein